MKSIQVVREVFIVVESGHKHVVFNVVGAFMSIEDADKWIKKEVKKEQTPERFFVSDLSVLYEVGESPENLRIFHNDDTARV